MKFFPKLWFVADVYLFREKNMTISTRSQTRKSKAKKIQSRQTTGKSGPKDEKFENLKEPIKKESKKVKLRDLKIESGGDLEPLLTQSEEQKSMMDDENGFFQTNRYTHN